MNLDPNTKFPHGVIPSNPLYDPGNGLPLQDLFDSNSRVRAVSLFQRMRRNGIVGIEFFAGLQVVPVSSLPNGDYETDCIVCRQSYVPENPAAADSPVQLPCCGRGLHKECLAEWMASGNYDCLTCRKNFFKRERAYSLERATRIDPALLRRDDDQQQQADTHQAPDSKDTEINEYDDDAAMNPNKEWELNTINLNDEATRPYQDDDPDEILHLRFSNPIKANINFRLGDPPLVPISHYRELLRAGLEMQPLEPKRRALTIGNQVSMFRALQRVGAFDFEGMRRMYWYERGWHKPMVFEHLMSKNTKWCVEHGKWFRETERREHRHLDFHVASRPRLGELV